MKKISLFLLTLLLFAPNISAEEETVYLKLSGGPITNSAQYSGTYNKKVSDEKVNKNNFSTSFWYSNNSYSEPKFTVKIPATNSMVSYPRIYSFSVLSNDGSRGFDINFKDTWDYLGLRYSTTSDKTNYALNISDPRSNGSIQGILLKTNNEGNVHLQMVIKTTNPQLRIKKVIFGNPLGGYEDILTDSDGDYLYNSLSNFSEADTESTLKTYNCEGSWSFIPDDNYIAFTPDTPTDEIEFRKVTDGADIRLSYIGIVWDAPLDAPTVNIPFIPEDAKLTPTEVNTDFNYTYTVNPAVLKFNMPEGAAKMIYTTVNNNPQENWIEYDANTGVVLADNAVWGQQTTVQIAGVDDAGNVGMTCTVNCTRKTPNAPDRPSLISYAKAFDYIFDKAGIQQKIIPVGNWIEANPNDLVVEANSNAIVLNLRDPYNSAKDHQTGSVIAVQPVGTLEYAITSYSTPDAQTAFHDAITFQGSVGDKAEWVDQHTWFVYGTSQTTTINGEVSENSDYTVNTDAGDFFKNGVDSECYLHLRAYISIGDEKIYSDILTVKVVRTPLEAPEILPDPDDNYSWIDGNVPRMTYAKSAKVMVNLPENAPEGTYLQFAFDNGITTRTEPASSGRTRVSSDNTISFPIEQNVEMKTAGRLFVQTRNDNTGQVGPWAMVDVEPIETTSYYIDGSNTPVNGFSQNQLINLWGDPQNRNLRVVDVFATDADLEANKTTYYVYLENASHDAIKLVVNSRTEPAVFATYKSGDDGLDRIIDGGEILGRLAYRNFLNGKGIMPEIMITPTPDESFINYLPKAKPGNFPTIDNGKGFCPDVSAVGGADFNKKVRLRGLEKIGGSDKVRGMDGTEYTIFPRLHPQNETEIEEALANMEDGNVYAVTCFVGQTVGALALLPCDVPVECPDTPELFAPNPITDGELDAISPELNITIGNIRQHNMTYYWSVGKVDDPDTQSNRLTKVELVKGVPTITLKKESYPTDKCDLWVYAQSAEGLWSLEPAQIAIEWHEVKSVVTSISEFKNLYIGKENDLPESISDLRVSFDTDLYHQFSHESKAIVVEATEEWLYVRDLNTTDADGKFHSANYILIHNNDKWINPPVPEGDTVRMLRRGDIITNFALVPAHSHRGNLVSESTGFARTFWFVDSLKGFEPALRPINVGYSDPTVEPDPDNDDYSGYYSNIKLGENQRMRYLDIRNVKIQKNNDDYFLVLGEGNIALAFDIFEECLNGWETAYNPENPDELYNIKGVFIKNEHDRDDSYAIAMIDFGTNNGQVTAPKLYVTEAANKDADVQQFVNSLDVVIEHEEGTMVLYTTDGSDPKNVNNAARKSYEGPFTLPAPTDGRDRLTVKAYAYKPGWKPSSTVSKIFVRNSTEVQYILNYLNLAREGRNYRFTSNLKIIATGGRYMFLAGPMGSFLPVYNEDGWEGTDIAAGRYVKGFTVGYKVDANGNRIAVATGHMSTFNNVTSPRPEFGNLTPEEDQFHAEPDTLTAISAANARRLVTLMSVTVNKTASAALDDEEQWTISVPQTDSEHPLMVGRLGKVGAYKLDDAGNRVPEELTDGATYNLTGFVMLGKPDREGEVEFWPLQADRVTRTGRATARITNTIGNPTTQPNGDVFANFSGTTTVTLTNKENNATIYYMIDSHNPDLSTAKWYTYQHPIIIDKSDVIRVKCQAPGFAESNIIILTLTKVEKTGDVSFDVTSEYGKTTVRLSAEPGAVIYYGVNDPTCPQRYTAPRVFTQGAELYACAQVPGKPRGAVSKLQVMVVGGTTSTVSGKVQFELDEGTNGAKLVKISPVDELEPGSYTIYYTTQTGVPFAVDKWTKYTGPFELTESSAVLAVLMENNKPVGEISETYVFVGAVTGIDGVDSDNRDENSVRVEGGSIIAPEGSQVFDINGRRVNPEGLRRGIYIVQIPGAKAVKVKVN